MVLLTWALYSPGMAPGFSLYARSEKRPLASVTPNAPVAPEPVGTRTTCAPSTGLPSSVTTPEAGTVLGRWLPREPQPSVARPITSRQAKTPDFKVVTVAEYWVLSTQ